LSSDVGGRRGIAGLTTTTRSRSFVQGMGLPGSPSLCCTVTVWQAGQEDCRRPRRPGPTCLTLIPALYVRFAAGAAASGLQNSLSLTCLYLSASVVGLEGVGVQLGDSSRPLPDRCSMTRQRMKVGPGECLGGWLVLIRATTVARLQRELASALHTEWVWSSFFFSTVSVRIECTIGQISSPVVDPVLCVNWYQAVRGISSCLLCTTLMYCSCTCPG
jgi:hypothetical protein